MLKRKSQLAWLGLSLVIILLDQITKVLISQHFSYGEVKPILPFFNLTLAYNQGAAFSFLSDAGGWQRWGLSVVAIVISVILVVWLYRLSSYAKWTAAALALVIGGALGNLYDRITLGHVVDFLDLYVGRWHWPAFNVADSAITIGIVILLLTTFKSKN